jgi:hypothetical protein
MTDRQESIAGTDPDDPNSSLHIISVSLQPGGCQIVWTSEADKNYQVFATADLSQAFAPISGTIPSAGSTTSYTDPAPGNTRTYYKVQVVP